ncbi:calcium homeostasis modulator protein-like [Sphaeramia orbicularis]|uniref:calcium homeostasis modulator protein-like n=1 Tax=Sphaeramia orbicularis TaxID=375764 RepID=UPI0011811346|nr:calcium homeostasis modulator protein-like [Sphaeramia orbicularis]
MEITTHPDVFEMMNGLLLIGMEKVLEAEFVCPCLPDMNFRYAVVHFVAPSCLLFMVMFSIRSSSDCCSKETWVLMVKSLVLPFTWVFLLLMDGRYFVCGKSYWPGRLVKHDDLIAKKWCEPVNTTLAAELEEETWRWFSESKFWGMIVILIVSGGCMLYHLCSCCKSCKKNPKGGGQSPSEPQQHPPDDGSSSIPLERVDTSGHPVNEEE